MVNIACHTMQTGEVLNASHLEFPLHHAILFGDKVSTAKFSKRLSCSIKHLPLRLSFSYEYDTLRAIEAGVIMDPTLVVDGVIFLEGLIQAELITEKFKILLKEF